jgi:hypothetical protein
MGVAYLSAFAAACPECWDEVDAVALHWVRFVPSPSLETLTDTLTRSTTPPGTPATSTFVFSPPLFP